MGARGHCVTPAAGSSSWGATVIRTHVIIAMNYIGETPRIPLNQPYNTPLYNPLCNSL